MNKSFSFLLLLILVASVLAYILTILNQEVYLPMLISVLLIALSVKNQLNIIHLSTLLSILIVLEIITAFFMAPYTAKFPAYKANAYIFSIHLVFDLMSFYTVKHRVKISLFLVERFQPQKKEYVYMTHADILLVGVFFLFIIVDVSAFIENLIRNMDYIFGVAEETAKPYWSWNWIYQSYPYAKAILLAAVVTVLLATVYVERFRPAPINESEEDLTPKKSEPQHKS
ncbi:hypothetical protein [Pseudoalteromonas sp. PS5]|uniref:hypothetical protein n=1 Tax=Pseudoalteromonas sp. PS5 TaxID=1437473 RepID=UPI000FFF374C|nr:hypothetical protein [Pseudoalteromonas sp. PS5]RXF04160.1 hypothetical protein D9603_06665 [Pseudoalteromonas sp. PS5]